MPEPNEKPETPKAKSKTQVAIPCTVFSRVVGYISPTNAWNKGKREEEKERLYYKMDGVNNG